MKWAMPGAKREAYWYSGGKCGLVNSWNHLVQRYVHCPGLQQGAIIKEVKLVAATM